MPPLTVLSWNVNGLRAVHKKGALADLLHMLHQQQGNNAAPDVVCLQEIRCTEPVARTILASIAPQYPHVCIHPSTDRKGYSGTAILSKLPPLAPPVRDFPASGRGDDDNSGSGSGSSDPREGRLIAWRLAGDITVVCVYAPNSQEHLRRLTYRTEDWEPKFRDYMRALNQATRGRVVVCGDLNVAHREIDIHHPKRNVAHAGFTPQERAAMDALLEHAQLSDTFRQLHPEAVKYSYWSNFGNARAKNKGWRIDYVLAGAALAGRRSSRLLIGADILTDVQGSDHAPVTATFAIT
jgi:exodeoxyribonuclease III